MTHRRRQLFSTEENIERLRNAVRVVKNELPFEIKAAVVLHDHIHFLWTLPPGDNRYSKRIGRMKVEFTRAFSATSLLRRGASQSREKHRESDVWQRRFWEHTIRDEHDFERHFDYIHHLSPCLEVEQLSQLGDERCVRSVLGLQLWRP